MVGVLGPLLGISDGAMQPFRAAAEAGIATTLLRRPTSSTCRAARRPRAAAPRGAGRGRHLDGVAIAVAIGPSAVEHRAHVLQAAQHTLGEEEAQGQLGIGALVWHGDRDGLSSHADVQRLLNGDHVFLVHCCKPARRVTDLRSMLMRWPMDRGGP